MRINLVGPMSDFVKQPAFGLMLTNDSSVENLSVSADIAAPPTQTSELMPR